MWTLLRSFCAGAMLLGSNVATALPVLSVDLNPGLAGIQATRSVVLGASFTVDVFISAVEASAPLDAFELDLAFDPSRLAATQVVLGGFLQSPVQELANGLFPEVDFAATSLGNSGSIGAGILARLTFEAILAGTTPLDLNDVLLSAPFGVPIAGATLEDGTLNVVALPEPALLPAFAMLLAGLATRRRDTGERTR